MADASAAAVCVSSWLVKIGVRISSPMQMPAWRAAIVQPPWIPSGERPASAVAVSALIASASPAPIAIWGAISHCQLGAGQHRQRQQPAADQKRAADRAGPRRCRPAGSSRYTASAASGITVTTAAACERRVAPSR